MTQPIGQKLKQVREEQNLTIEKASEATHIRAPYIKALEDGDLSVLPSPVQARGFMRNYAEYLGLNFDQLIAELRAELNPGDQIIGPLESASQSASSPSESLTSETSTPLTSPEPDSTTQNISQAESTLTKPKRRSRKLVELKPEQEPVVDAKQQDAMEDPVVQFVPQHAPETTLEPNQAPQPEPDITENLWQTWLNRISSIISRRTAPIPLSEDAAPSESLISDADVMEQDSVLQNLESTQIFKEIGIELRQRRELLSLHLEEVERNTHVKAHYLEALEMGAMDNLPSTVQTRGMLSNYATFLDLDVDALLLRYADALQARHREKNPQKPLRKPGQPIVANIPPLSSFIAGDMIFGVGIAVLLIGFCIWGINRVMMIQSLQEVQPTAPSISDVLLASPDASLFTPTATLLPAESFDEATATIVIPTQNLNVSVQLNLVAVERTFMRVVVDGEEVYNGRVVPGTAYPFEAEDQIEILVGSGAAIRIVYNGRDMGLMGGLGQVINNIYRADEIITPTALPTETPTSTVIPTSTVRPTLTALSTSTVIPSRTPIP
jgi:cytoskeleton protein RodZ